MIWSADFFLHATCVARRSAQRKTTVLHDSWSRLEFGLLQCSDRHYTLSMNPKDYIEANFRQDESNSIGIQSNSFASLHGSVTTKTSSSNSPIPYIDFSDARASYLRKVLPVPPNGGKRQRGGVSDPFPCRLHRMLSCAETQGWETIVSWQPHGRSFHVHDWAALHNVIIPRCVL